MFNGGHDYNVLPIEVLPYSRKFIIFITFHSGFQQSDWALFLSTAYLFHSYNMYKDVLRGTLDNITTSQNHPGFPQLQLESLLCFPLGLNQLSSVHGPQLHTSLSATP